MECCLDNSIREVKKKKNDTRKFLIFCFVGNVGPNSPLLKECYVLQWCNFTSEFITGDPSPDITTGIHLLAARKSAEYWRLHPYLIQQSSRDSPKAKKLIRKLLQKQSLPLFLSVVLHSVHLGHQKAVTTNLGITYLFYSDKNPRCYKMPLNSPCVQVVLSGFSFLLCL